MIDLDAIKGRFVEALIEGIFRRASYQVSRLDREGAVPKRKASENARHVQGGRGQ